MVDGPVFFDSLGGCLRPFFCGAVTVKKSVVEDAGSVVDVTLGGLLWSEVFELLGFLLSEEPLLFRGGKIFIMSPLI